MRCRTARLAALCSAAVAALASHTTRELAHAESCHGQPVAQPTVALKQGEVAPPPRVEISTSVGVRYASFRRSVGGGQVLSLIPGVAAWYRGFGAYVDITANHRTLGHHALSALGNLTFGVSGTRWVGGTAAHRFGATVHVDGMAPADGDILVGDNHWMIMPSLVGHWAWRGWRADVGAMYHHSFVSGDHRSDYHILNVVRPMRHAGESLVVMVGNQVSPRLWVDVSGTLNVSSSLQMGSLGVGYGVANRWRVGARLGVVTLLGDLDSVVSLSVSRGW